MKLIPPLEYIQSRSTAEVRVARLLSRLDGDPAAYAFYSVGLTRHPQKLRAEADFIVLWRGAVLVLEVKGGSLTRHEGVWTIADAQGCSYSKRESPWEQASGNMFALREYLDERLVGRRPAYGVLVVTPDQRIPRGVEWDPWEWAGPDAMTSANFSRALDSAAAHARSKAHLPEIHSLKAVRDALRPEFDAVRLLPDIAEAIEGQMARLLESQIDVLSGLEDFPRVIVEGGAGTGKTLLGMEAARRAAAQGLQVLFTCRSESVLSYIGAELESAGVTVVPFDRLRDLPRFDLVVIDEAQDLMNIEDLPALEAVLSGPIDTSRWWLFLDPNNQSRIDGVFDDEAYSLIKESSVARYRLRLNFRNTANIVSQVQTYIDADLGTPRIGEGPRVRTEVFEDQARMVELVRAKLGVLIGDGVSARDIAVISAQGATRVVDAGGKSFEFMTPRQAKGLEFKYVLIVDVDDLSAEGWQSRLYVAMTRAKVELWICLSKRAEGQIKEIARANVSRLLERAADD